MTAQTPLPSPGAYLRLRREAARVTIEEVALVGWGPAQRAFMAETLAELENDTLAQIGADVIAERLRRLQPFRFDIGVYEQLVDLAADPDNPDLPRPAICRTCGCSWSDPCIDRFDRTCSWATPAHDLCSRCAPRDPKAEARAELRQGGKDAAAGLIVAALAGATLLIAHMPATAGAGGFA